MKHSALQLTLVASVFAGACAAQGAAPKPPAPPTPVAAPPSASSPMPPVGAQPPSAPSAPSVPAAPLRPSAPQVGDGVHWFRAAAEYRAITLSTYRAATEAVTLAAKDRPRDSWAVSLDADETILDNSVFQRDLNVPFTEDLWATFVRQRSSVPVPGAKAFLETVKALGGRIAIVTNRYSHLCEDTKENFRLLSLPFDVILCRVDTGDKNPRFASVASGTAFADGKGREVVAFVGDNILDFPGMTQSLRDGPESAFEAFGRRFFVLPNPMYGSWQQVSIR